jgi:RimJ/RimL family protein N-acetyltransferase
VALSSAPGISIRQIRADDVERLHAHHGRLSAESRYRRFLSTKPQLSSADARYLVEVDGCDHFALVATMPDASDAAGESIVGVARFIRIPGECDVAEMAIVVGDDYQRTGLGTELVTRLAQAAVDRGVRRFRATMFPDNLGIRRLLENLAVGPVQYAVLGGVAEMELWLPGGEHAGADCGDAPHFAAA